MNQMPGVRPSRFRPRGGRFHAWYRAPGVVVLDEVFRGPLPPVPLFPAAVDLDKVEAVGLKLLGGKPANADVFLVALPRRIFPSSTYNSRSATEAV